MAKYIEVDKEAVESKLAKIRHLGGDMKPVFRQIIDAFYKIQQNVVFNQKANGPGRYADLKKSTKINKIRKIGHAYPILVFSGNLKRSFKDGGGGNITRITNQWAEAGSRLNYGVFHQTGTRKMPARPPILESSFSPTDRLGVQINGILDSYLSKIMG